MTFTLAPLVNNSARSPAAISPWRGEFVDSAREHAFTIDGLGETIRHARRLMIAAAILNALFYISDWRFHGLAQFRIAIPARTFVIAGSLIAWALLGRVRTPRGADLVLAGWIATTAIGVTVLVSSHSELALFVVLLLPLIFYLAVPLPFVATLAGGGGASAMLLGGYASHGDDPLVGLAIALLTLNCALALVVARSNRLRRGEWRATCIANETAAALALSRHTLELTFAATPVPMIVCRAEDGLVFRANDSAMHMFGVTADRIGTVSSASFYADPGARERLMALLARYGQVDDFETTALCSNGQIRTVLIKATLVTLETGPTVIAGLIDISDRKAIETNLERLASTDPLTRLPNRLSFFANARAEMSRSRRLGRPVALMMIDLDHFKTINDTYGHLGGDQLLRALGRLCGTQFQGEDLVGRLGGEEFAILLPDTGAARAIELAEDLRAAIADIRLPPPHVSLRATASFGITLLQPEDDHLDVALARADRALYVAKRSGRNRIHIDPAEYACHPALPEVGENFPTGLPLRQ